MKKEMHYFEVWLIICAIIKKVTKKKNFLIYKKKERNSHK